MKPIFILTIILLSAARTTDTRRAMICHTWRLIGIKPFGKDFKPVQDPKFEVLTIKSDGTYEKLLYGQMKITGSWDFAADSSKLVFSTTSAGGMTMPSAPLDKTHPIDSIIVLNSDTLIKGMLAYFGPEKKYGHNDWYYIREADKK
jgi:hypothetical protein